MSKLFIIFDSRSRNTGKMASAIADGAKSVKGAEVILKNIVSARAEELKDADAVILGSPTHWGEPTSKMKRFLKELKWLVVKGDVDLKKKAGVAFGSYKWGEEAVHIVEGDMKFFEMNIIEPGLRVVGTPDKEDLEKCRKLGRLLARKIVKS